MSVLHCMKWTNTFLNTILFIFHYIPLNVYCIMDYISLFPFVTAEKDEPYHSLGKGILTNIKAEAKSITLTV